MFLKLLKKKPAVFHHQEELQWNFTCLLIIPLITLVMLFLLIIYLTE